MGSPFRSTTIVAVQRDGKAAIAGDGQVTLSEQTIMKHGAKKVRRLYKGQVVAGFAGSAADALTLFDRFEAMLEQHQGNLMRGAIELAKEWRTDRTLRRLEALLLVADSERILLLSGTGEVIEPDEGVAAIGSGGPYALAAARALMTHTELPSRDIACESITIASQICVFTNDRITVEEIGSDQSQSGSLSGRGG